MNRWLWLVTAVALVACAGTPATTATIEGRVVAGPVCPVESDPPDPACAPRPVEGAEIIATDGDGRRYRTESGADGRFRLAVTPALLTVVFSPVEGLMGIPAPLEVEAGDGEVVDLGDIAYDTGIR